MQFYLGIIFILIGISLLLFNKVNPTLKESKIQISKIDRDVVTRCPITQDRIYTCKCGTLYTKDGYDYMINNGTHCTKCNSS